MKYYDARGEREMSKGPKGEHTTITVGLLARGAIVVIYGLGAVGTREDNSWMDNPQIKWKRKRQTPLLSNAFWQSSIPTIERTVISISWLRFRIRNLTKSKCANRRCRCIHSAANSDRITVKAFDRVFQANVQCLRWFSVDGKVFRVSAILDLVVFWYICVPCFLFLLFISFASVLDWKICNFVSKLTFDATRWGKCEMKCGEY